MKVQLVNDLNRVSTGWIFGFLSLNSSSKNMGTMKLCTYTRLIRLRRGLMDLTIIVRKQRGSCDVALDKPATWTIFRLVDRGPSSKSLTLTISS